MSQCITLKSELIGYLNYTKDRFGVVLKTTCLVRTLHVTSRFSVHTNSVKTSSPCTTPKKGWSAVSVNILFR